MEQIPFVSKGVSSFHVPSSALYNMNVQHLLPEFLCNINNDTTISHMIFNLYVCSADWVQHVLPHRTGASISGRMGDSKSFTSNLQQM
jgi:hypothetical protein